MLTILKQKLHLLEYGPNVNPSAFSLDQLTQIKQSIDLTFLKNELDSSVFGLLCKESNNKISVKAYNIDQNIKEISYPIWKKEINDNQAFLIAVPEPYGVNVIFSCKQGEITNYAMIDSNGQRYLLSNTIDQFLLQESTNLEDCSQTWLKPILDCLESDNKLKKSYIYESHNYSTIISCTKISRSLEKSMVHHDDQTRLDSLALLCENPKTTECIIG
ncbi:unnamed protein product [Brachionus calyciflorus]|uniref:Uncharacterized protein n=1 Tax=Brachionus calyciflorus TaxID=104777 RepID=A0A813XMN7_9BILA|nr:unnamed protein product [Brachionus calyciflorus]